MTKTTLFNICLIIILVLVILDQWIFLNLYGIKTTDGDQTLFWLFAQDLSNGVFHSPYLYGQNYNIPIESYFGSTLVFLGLMPHQALPITCVVLINSCFLLLAYYFYRQENRLACLISISSILLMPLEWQVITGIPRGFIGGIVIAIWGILLLFSSTKRASQILGSFLVVFSLLVSPNAVIIIVPAGILFLYERKLDIKSNLLGLLLGILIYLPLHFYKEHNSHVLVHKAWQIDWSLANYSLFFQSFKDHFKALFPLFYEAGVGILLVIITIAILALIKKHKGVLMASLGLILLIIITFGINKVQDGSGSVYFPYSRMYLGLPFACLLLAGKLNFSRKSKSIIIVLVSVIGLVSFALKQSFFNERVKRVNETNSGVVEIIKVEKLKEQCYELEELSKKEAVDLVVFHSKSDLLNYGCNCINGLQTLHPAYERRHWLIDSFSPKSLNQIMFLDWYGTLEKQVANDSLFKVENTWFPAYRIDNAEKQLKDLYSF